MHKVSAWGWLDAGEAISSTHVEHKHAENAPRSPENLPLFWRLGRAGYRAATSATSFASLCLSPISRKFRERSGRFTKSGRAVSVWIHACSAGEMMVARRFAECWKARTGNARVFISAWTPDGYGIATSWQGHEDRVGWFPVDSKGAMRRAFADLQPKAVILCETELWPNHLAEAQARRIPVFVVNGRMSLRDQAKYRRLGRFGAAFFAVPDTVFSQSEDDARRFSALGARRTVVTGNMKFDAAHADTAHCADLGQLRQRPYILAASTHPREEVVVLRAFQACAAAHPGVRLVIAPRHVKRSSSVARLARRSGLRTSLWPREGGIEDAQCLVVDRMGLLPRLYEGATFAFVGKSLHAHGGQNFLEAAEAGCAVIIGPHTENFDDVLAPFTAAGAVWQLRGAHELCEAFGTLVAHPRKTEEMATGARRILERHRGATERTVGEILSRL